VRIEYLGCSSDCQFKSDRPDVPSRVPVGLAVILWPGIFTGLGCARMRLVMKFECLYSLVNSSPDMHRKAPMHFAWQLCGHPRFGPFL
jgi:hypothetical protein